MNLFQIKDHILSYSPQALGLKPFKALWARDKSKDKSLATAELSFVFYFADGRSDFRNEVNEEKRIDLIIEAISGFPKGWKPDEKVMVAIDFYREMTTTISSKLLEDGEHAAAKLSEFLRNIDLEERDDKNKPIYQPKAISDTLKTLPSVVESLQQTKKKVEKELKESSGARGSQEKGAFEDGF